MVLIRAAWLAAIAAALASSGAGCAGSSSVRCGDDRLCPAGTVCVDITVPPAEQLCATRDELAACAGLPDFAGCGDGLRCYSGVCLPGDCGNRRVDRADPLDPDDVAEQCDDGNNTPGDGCSADCRSDERCRNGVVDSATEQCDDANPVSHDGCSSACTLEPVAWVPVTDADLQRAGYAMSYDARRERVLLFGGRSDLFVPVLHGDTLEWDGVSWRVLPTELAPSPRSDPALAYDPVRDRSVLFGGTGNGDLFADTWEWDGARWLPIDPAAAPPRRQNHAMVYDPIRRQIVLFGGLGGGLLGDTWTWDGARWSQLAPLIQPPPRFGHAMAFDARSGAVVMFGGRNAEGDLDDTWRLTGDQWVLIGGPGPAPRHDHAMTTDPATGTVLLVGGRNTNQVPITDTWQFDGSWTLLDPSGPELVDHGAVAYPPRASAVAVSATGFTLEWTGTAWAGAGFTTPQFPAARAEHAVALDPVHRRIMMFGGRTALGAAADTWVWDGRWGQAATARVVPPPRFSAALAYDAARDQLVLFGGTDQQRTLFGDTWVFNGVGWTELEVAGPPARHSHMMAYDPARAQIVVFGGTTEAGQAGDTWIWDGARWSERPVAGPPPTATAAFAYDPPRRELVLFGGSTDAGISGDTWTWDGVTWTKRSPTRQPPPRFAAAMAYDAARRRLVMMGGVRQLTLDDVWEWDGADWAPVTIAPAITTRSGHALVPSPDGDSLFVFGGEHRTEIFNELRADLVALRRGSAPVADRCAARDTDGDGLAGCADPDCWHRCTPQCPHGVAATAPECTTGPRCGDSICAPSESCGLCPTDCGDCPVLCGDLQCSPGEAAADCPGDCA